MFVISPDGRFVTCNSLTFEACTSASTDKLFPIRMKMELIDMRGATPFAAGHCDIVVSSIVQRI